jgi:acyl-CoA synthetase (AMP-forming)/AMP-acid ligase II
VKTIFYDPNSLAEFTDSTPIPDERLRDRTLDDLAGLIYTSGSTGLPKAVLINTARELVGGYLIANYLRLKPTDRFYTCMPLYHAAAHSLCVIASINSGCTVVLGRKFSHQRFWPEVRESEASIIQYVGELCRYLLNAPASPLDKEHNVRMAWGNGMRPDVWMKFRERFGVEIINELYAATDGMASSYNPNRGEFTQGAIGLRGPIFKILHGGNEARVKIDPDTEDILRSEDGFAIKCKAGEPGEVIYRLDPKTPNPAFKGYWKDEAAGRKKNIKDVFKMGDL